MGCATDFRGAFIRSSHKQKVKDAFLIGLFLSVKNVTENDARGAFSSQLKAAEQSNTVCSTGKNLALGSKCRQPPVVSHISASPYMVFFLTSADPIIANPTRNQIWRYLSEGDIASSLSTIPMRESLRDFIDANPLWKDKTTSYISLLEIPNLERAIISRFQTSGNCFMIAPFVALHYAINFCASALDNRTVDITEYARKYLESSSLAALLLHNVGSYTDSITRSIFMPALGEREPFTKSLLISRHQTSNSSFSSYAHLVADLISNGIGIMGYMITDDDFKNASSTSYTGERSHTALAPEGHAMVLIGVRFDVLSGQYYLLLQNSWKTLPVVEVRQDYAASCRATLMFVTTPQHGYRAAWPTVTFHSAVAAVNAGVMPLRSSIM